MGFEVLERVRGVLPASASLGLLVDLAFKLGICY